MQPNFLFHFHFEYILYETYIIQIIALYERNVELSCTFAIKIRIIKDFATRGD